MFLVLLAFCISTWSGPLLRNASCSGVQGVLKRSLFQDKEIRFQVAGGLGRQKCKYINETLHLKGKIWERCLSIVLVYVLSDLNSCCSSHLLNSWWDCMGCCLSLCTMILYHVHLSLIFRCCVPGGNLAASPRTLLLSVHPYEWSVLKRKSLSRRASWEEAFSCALNTNCLRRWRAKWVARISFELCCEAVLP